MIPPIVSSQILLYWRLTPSAQIIWRQVEPFFYFSNLEVGKDLPDIEIFTSYFRCLYSFLK